MTVILINIPDDVFQRVLDGNKYQRTIDDGDGNQIPNPELGEIFLSKLAANSIKENVRNFEIQSKSVQVHRDSDTAINLILDDVNRAMDFDPVNPVKK